MGRRRPKTCDGRNDGIQCYNRKDLKRIDLVTGWGLPKEQQTYYQLFLCPSCTKNVLPATKGGE